MGAQKIAKIFLQVQINNLFSVKAAEKINKEELS